MGAAAWRAQSRRSGRYARADRGECAARAAALCDPELPERLSRIVDQMREEQPRPREFMVLDNRFHAAIAAAAQNALYLSLSNTIQSLVSVWYAQTFRMRPTKAATIEEHSAIAAAIRAKQPEAAREAMRRHILYAAERLQSVLRSRQPAESLEQAGAGQMGACRMG